MQSDGWRLRRRPRDGSVRRQVRQGSNDGICFELVCGEAAQIAGLTRSRQIVDISSGAFHVRCQSLEKIEPAECDGRWDRLGLAEFGGCLSPVEADPAAGVRP